MVSPILQAALLCGTTWILWKVFRGFLLKNDLDNLPGPTSPSFIYGNIRQLFNRQSFKFHRSLGETYGSVVRLHGRFGSNMLYTFDPKAMHHIVIKDQDIFEEPTWFTRLATHVLGVGLFATLGDHHRQQRKMLNPVFSIKHMRDMTPLFYEISHKLRTALQSRVRDARPTEIDMLDAADEYGTALKNLVPTIARARGLQQFIPVFEAIVPAGWRRTVAELIPVAALKEIIRITDTLRIRSTEIFKAKKAALLAGDEALKQQVGEGRDLISILLKANMAVSEEDRMPEDELIGQMSTLTFAAMDTTSNALSLTLWRLAQNPEVQAKLRQEIFDAQESHGSADIGYDDLVALPYMDAVCRETLRIHVPAPFGFREVRKDVVLPLSEPVRGKDGRMMHELLVPKDTSVFVGINASNTNPALWGEDAYKWKPERWLQALPDAVLDAKIPGVYANLMTFWGGGRACIGFKFSQLEMKVVLAVLISTFTFELTDKPVWWNMAGVQYPSADADGEHPGLPMKVRLVKREA
ncbi:cytochrome P450 [Trametes versicolor FP-101664 SS1]|uniref:cytochrome P450 n=1 Tax=Trametes versicolor (strain FP-101664) TaxID=717944 RepID=UPI0004622749|nr:cytochrome P450 [Trametes versicolor FP-101664 SS1]EIW62374.1 cytochrome P450 [Trametes versicolor FP-101664 SS1]